MTNPFDDEDGVFHVLRNDEGQYSIWPSFVAVPAGWIVVLESASRSECLALIDREWTDMRPNNLVAVMNDK